MSTNDWRATLHELAIADYDGDGIPDLLFRPTVDEQGTKLALGIGDGTFHTAINITRHHVMGSPLWSSLDRELLIADFDGDGAADVFLRGRTDTDDSFILFDVAP